jgi:hypothetical protein
MLVDKLCKNIDLDLRSFLMLFTAAPTPTLRHAESRCATKHSIAHGHGAIFNEKGFCYSMFTFSSIGFKISRFF